jgi:hypothetical protein
MKVKVNEASGHVLDWMVAECEGHVESGVYGEPVLRDGQLHIHYCGVVLDDVWCPTTNWAQGGPILEWEKIDLYQSTGRTCAAMWENLPGGGRLIAEAKDCPTPLIAAMRCFVSSKLGDEVEVPDELV